MKLNINTLRIAIVAWLVAIFALPGCVMPQRPINRGPNRIPYQNPYDRYWVGQRAVPPNTVNRIVEEALKPNQGFGTIMATSVLLNKNTAVNDAIGGGCNIASKLLGAQECFPEYNIHRQLLLVELSAGEKLGFGNRQVGRMRRHTQTQIEFELGTALAPNSCLGIVTDQGIPVPVRDTGEEYLFRNPLYFAAQKKAKIDSLSRQLAETIRLQTSAETGLESNSAFQNGQCRLIARRSRPPKPATMTDSEVNFQAQGACVDMFSNRYAIRDVYEALASIQEREMVTLHQHWLKAKPASCTKLVSRDQSGDIGCRMAKAFSIPVFRSCVLDAISQCITEAKNACRSPLTQWEQEIAHIEREPEVKKTACQNDLNSIAKSRTKITELQTELEAARSEYNSTPEISQNSIGIEQATCKF